MSMTAQVFSISALSVELGRDRRTIGKALARVPPDGETADGRQGWFLTTAQRALESSEDRRHRGEPLDDSDLLRPEQAARAADAFLDRLSTGRGISSLWGAQFSPLGGDGDQPFERSAAPCFGGRPRRLIGAVDD